MTNLGSEQEKFATTFICLLITIVFWGLFPEACSDQWLNVQSSAGIASR